MLVTRSVRRFLVLALLLHSCGAYPQQAVAKPAAKRQQALDLFAQGKRLQALPLLEGLVKANPKDDEALVALAASLLDHAVTLTDEKAAAAERFRARDLLDRAWKLGNTSPLAMNLSQFLQQLPPSGAIEFSKDPRVEQSMQAGEAAFARRDFDEALKNYSHAIELEPTNYSAALFSGNTYDRQNNFSKAAEWYQRAIQIDPNIETAYRYYADMLARQNDLVDARKMLIQAAVAEPYNRVVWRELRAWGKLSGSQINLVYVSIPPPGDKSADGKPDSLQKPAVSSAWDAYRTIRTQWQQAGEFAKYFPQEKNYRHSLPEESSALRAAATKLSDLHANPDTSALIAKDLAATELLKLYDAGVIEPYVLFSLGDIGIAQDYAAYRESNRSKLENYMDHFVVPMPSH
ncbi:MAG TPA: tetratricopeptide repeat protein [Candidatus Angelobacter sp.]|nr:tetratricopeptide repeat protein [Candidatus Angelobacter sp.]